jgi:hypothetical protein
MIQAEFHQGIGQKPIGLDRQVARLAEAVCAVIHAGEGRVYVLEKIQQFRGFARFPHRGVQSLAASYKLLSEEMIETGGHGNLPFGTGYHRGFEDVKICLSRRILGSEMKKGIPADPESP